MAQMVLYPPIMPQVLGCSIVTLCGHLIYTMLSQQFALLVATTLMTGMCPDPHFPWGAGHETSPDPRFFLMRTCTNNLKIGSCQI